VKKINCSAFIDDFSKKFHLSSRDKVACYCYVCYWFLDHVGMRECLFVAEISHIHTWRNDSRESYEILKKWEKRKISRRISRRIDFAIVLEWRISTTSRKPFRWSVHHTRADLSISRVRSRTLAASSIAANESRYWIDMNPDEKTLDQEMLWINCCGAHHRWSTREIDRLTGHVTTSSGLRAKAPRPHAHRFPPFSSISRSRSRAILP